MRKKYLVAYDYGQGAVWAVIKARSSDEIKERYPLLTVFDKRPYWMSWWTRKKIERSRCYDIDDEPADWLKEMS